MAGVIISPNIKKESARINTNGDIINPKTKQIIEKNEPGYMPTTEELAGIAQKSAQAPLARESIPTDPLSIQTQIDQAKANLAKLEELKKLKIAEMKKQLELLEQ